jgi:putative DNA primase/helicase
MNEIVQRHEVCAMGRLPLDAELRAKAIVDTLGGTWRGSRGECRCPAHDDGDPSLSVRLGDSAILFHCFAGCATTDVLKALHRLRLHDREPLEMPKAAPRRDNRGLAMRLWTASRPIAGTIGEDYLRARGLFGPYSRVLRFNPATVLGSGAAKRILPAMIAAVETDLGLVAVQRTFLDPLDILHKPIPKPKVSLGLLGTAAIRLAPATDELGLAEGIEDAQSVIEWFGTPTWALGGVERLAFVEIPHCVRRVTVFSDRGIAAERLLEKARDHLTANGRELINRPPPGRHQDWNDAWRAHRARRA